jgi:hypothetical protein
MIAFYVLTPIVHHLRDAIHPGLPSVLEGTRFVAVLVGAMISVSTRPAWIIVTVALGLVGVILKVVNDFLDSEALGIAMHLVVLAFLILVLWFMFRSIFASRRVTFNTVYASLCIYLLLGLVWALAYSVLDVIDPGSFASSGPAGHTASMLRIGKGDTAVLYFSFTTLTTLGYGDIVPTSPVSRMLASIEAITGQLYLAVLVSRLVGLHIAASIDQRMTHESGDDPDRV